MKRGYSSQGSPPPNAGASSSAKLHVPKKKSKLATTAHSAASTPVASSPPSTMAYSSPPPPPRGRSRSHDSRSRSRSRSRSSSMAPGNSKGKDRERDGSNAPEDQEQEQAGDGEGEDDEELLVFSDDEFGQNQKAMAKEKEDLRVLIEHFDADQMDRYETYRRSGLNKGAVRRLVNGILGQTVSPSILTVVRGFSKVFVGEIVEKARHVAGHDGSLTPQDIREAYRLYQLEHPGAGQAGVPKKKMFVR